MLFTKIFINPNNISQYSRYLYKSTPLQGKFLVVPPPAESRTKVLGGVKTSALFLNIFRLQSKVRTGFERFSTDSKYFCYFIEYHPIFITFGMVFDYYKSTKNPVNTENIERGVCKIILNAN